MQDFLDQNRSPKGVDTSDPRVQTRRLLQDAGNSKIASRQRRVLPEGHSCALWSFQVPWAPFEYYLKQNGAPEAKPFLWSKPFTVANTEWMMFFGVEPMEAEGRSSLWLGICNNLATSVTAYTKVDVLIPSANSDCGEVSNIGEAVDNLVPCGQAFQKNKFGRFWWHKSPQDFERLRFRGIGDSDAERSFEILLTVRLDPSNPTERTPAPEEDPRLWETSRAYLAPWVHARVNGISEPLKAQIRGLESECEKERERGVAMLQSEKEKATMVLKAKERDFAQREAELLAKADAAEQREKAAVEQCARAEAKLKDSLMREDKLKQQNSQLEKQVRELAAREKALKEQVGQLEGQLREAANREEQLRKWGQGLQQMVREGQAREEALTKEKNRLEEYIKNTQVREERFQAAIKELEYKLKENKMVNDHLRTDVQRLNNNVNDHREREDILRFSNARLYQANADEKLRTHAMSTSPTNPNSPARIRAAGVPAPKVPSVH
eukprot:TRINITY_DN11681_c0_g1_i2.p1 TRINITY_DN11681_c0_g1~~TRINITY_DN11681_c0_g1_i2.p1  ORF type:complete len:495 (+),score=214.30 TRINITY_DN11681_c0_g1_i2:46-1530(+)